MRLIAFLLVAAFALAGVVRYSKAAAPSPVTTPAPRETASLLGMTGVAQPPLPLASPGLPQSAPHVLRHKRRFAKAALRAIRQPALQAKAPPLKQIAKVVKQTRR